MNFSLRSIQRPNASLLWNGAEIKPESCESEWLGSSAASPQILTSWGLRTRSSHCDPSHPNAGLISSSLLCLALLLLLQTAVSAADPESDAARQRLESMTPAEKQKLNDKRIRFYSLSESERDRLRNLHRDLEQTDQSDQLRNVMKQYTDWLKSLPSGQRAELVSMPSEQRLQQIKLLIEQQETTRMKTLMAEELTEADRQAIVGWMEDLVDRHESELLERFPHLRANWESTEAPKRRQILIYLVTRMGATRGLLKPNAEDIQRLREQLSGDARQELDKAQENGRMDELGERWMRIAMFSRHFGSEVSAEELRKYYAELDPKQREFLESLPAERAQFELTKWYRWAQFRKNAELDGTRFPGHGDGYRNRGPGRGRGPDRPGGGGGPGGGFGPGSPGPKPRPDGQRPDDAPNADGPGAPRPEETPRVP